jgi:hypothetical protein
MHTYLIEHHGDSHFLFVAENYPCGLFAVSKSGIVDEHFHALHLFIPF